MITCKPLVYDQNNCTSTSKKIETHRLEEETNRILAKQKATIFQETHTIRDVCSQPREQLLVILDGQNLSAFTNSKSSLPNLAPKHSRNSMRKGQAQQCQKSAQQPDKESQSICSPNSPEHLKNLRQGCRALHPRSRARKKSCHQLVCISSNVRARGPTPKGLPIPSSRTHACMPFKI